MNAMLWHRLSSLGHSYDFSALRRAIDAALRTRERALVVDLDAIGFLDASIIRELILGLRRLREYGGTLHVSATRPAVMSSLQATGLDRVFRTI
ncbi:MAG: STAS domain-containing protein [Vulcanimicrobiaceae bacterium]